MHTQVSNLQAENAQLRSKIAALEAENEKLRQSNISTSALEKQLQQLMSSDTLSSGPNTLQQLQSFSMEAIASVAQSLAPDLMHLFNTLGDTRRNIEKGVKGVVPNEIKVLVSLCTLLNARSSRTTGLQLFLSLMLVARGTAKQVSSQYNEQC